MTTRARRRASPGSYLPPVPDDIQPLPSDGASPQLALAVGVLVTALAGIVYFLTAARDIVVGDSAEFVTVALTLGVAHPPGYPLLTMISRLFTLLPLDPEPFRINLVSVVCDTAAVAMVYVTARRLSGSVLAAGVAALVLGFTPVFWLWSLAIETFPLNNLLVAIFVYLMVRWYTEPTRHWFLVSAAFVAGLAMSNHHTFVLIAFGIGFMLWKRWRYWLNVQVIGLCIGAAVIGLLPYLYLPWAAGQDSFLNWGSLSSFNDLVRHFTRADYGSAQLVAGTSDTGSPGSRIGALITSFTPWGGLLIIAGAIGAYKRLRWYFWFVLAAFLPAGPAFAAYANIDLSQYSTRFVLERFFLLSHILLAPMMAIGIVYIRDYVAQRFPAVQARYVVGGIAGVAALAVVVSTATHYKEIDESGNFVASIYAEDLLNTVPQDAVILATGDQAVLPLAYQRSVKGFRPDTTVIMLGLIKGAAWYIPQIRERDPNLVIPFDRYTRDTNNLKALVDANPKRTFVLVGSPIDDSLDKDYWFYRTGLVSVILPMAKDIELEQMTKENTDFYAAYRPPTWEQIDPANFERDIIYQYALPAKLMGDQFEAVQQYEDAKAWYERALAIDPEFPAAREALAKVSSG